MNLSVNELRELVTALNQTDIAELTFKNAEFELTLRKPAAIQAAVATNSAPTAAATWPLAPASLPSSSPVAAPAAASPPAAPMIDPTLVEITAPMVGTFYRSPTPDEAVFVEVGDRIQSGQTVCIIEAMKLMNELETEISGEIVDILVENAEPIEFGQPLMRVRLAK
ncbi:MAG: acetyl-CoA carboxylase, biotin carboxyl carrier protein [Phormidesmis priestleyi]|uniref:Biotin carboxyl carrier protein of acetyl-CoA carboxylase n=1 Tax=Phormidesmis priestleyi TaxID=268141 RepID=A0A2W4XVS8_9CYAN|nr:MAG: acetyl-CoA carboxylase, biotin carboxyl carrier protein [Phormidesmis priestleyi]